MIYLVEDDNSIRELVLYTLNSSGTEAEGFDRPSAFWRAVEQRQPDMVILDIMLPEEDGLSVLRRLRETNPTVPVMMLTAKSTEFDKVVGLDAGADDYMAKPFGMMELMARVRALLRRAGGREQSGTLHTLGLLTLNVAQHTVKVGSESVSLTLKEFELLQLLLEHRGVVLTRDQLLNRVWGYAFDGENRTVDVHIRTLRQKLGPCGDYIETVRGVGYKIGGEVG